MDRTETAESSFLPIQEAARILKVSEKTLRRWEERHVLVPVRTPGGHRRYTTAQLVDFKKQKKNKTISSYDTPVYTPAPVTIESAQSVPVVAPAHTEERRLEPVTSPFTLREVDPVEEEPVQVKRSFSFPQISLPSFSFSLPEFASTGVFVLSCLLLFVMIRMVPGAVAQQYFSSTTTYIASLPHMLRNSGTKESTIARTTSTSRSKVLGTDNQYIQFTLNVDTLFNEEVTIKKDASISGSLAVNSGIITTTAETANLFTQNATTIAFGTGGTAISIGATTGTTTINNATTVVAGVLNVAGNRITSGGDLVIDPGGGGASIGPGTANLADSAEGDLFVSDELEVDGVLYAPTANISGVATIGTVSVNSDSITDFTGTGLLVSGGSLQAALGTSVSTAELEDGAVTTAKLADSAVTTAKVNDSAITNAKISDEAINEAKLLVSNSGTDGYTLTYNSSTGGFTWTAFPAATNYFTDAGPNVYITDTTDDFTVGSASNVARLGVVGDSDEIQALIRAHSTQTNNIFVVEQSDGTDIFSVGNTGGALLTNSGSSDTVINLSGTGDFVIQDNGVAFVTFTDSGTVQANDLTLSNGTITSSGNLTLTPASNLVISTLDCSGNTNGGALTANASGVISCSNDDGGGGASDWTSAGGLVTLQTTTNNVNIGGVTNLAKLSVDGDTDETQFLVQGNGTQTNFLGVFEQSTGTDVFTIANNGNLVSAGDLAVNGGDITSSSATVNLFNTALTTLNFGGAADDINIGYAGGNVTITSDVTITGTLTTAASDFAADGAVTLSPSGTNDVTFNLDADSTFVLNGVQPGSAASALCLSGSNNVITCDAAITITMQDAYDNDPDGTNVVVELTATDDSLVFRNPIAGGTESGYVALFEQLNLGAVDGVQILNAGTADSMQITNSSTGSFFNLIASGVGTTADGITIANTSSGAITDAIDASDTEIVNALNVGANTIAGTSAVIDFSNFDVDASGNVIAGGTLAAATDETINGVDISAGTVSDVVNLTINSGGDLTVGAIGLNDAGTSAADSGASLVGTYNGNFTNSTGTNVQDVLDDFDDALGAGSSKWTDGGAITYLTSITDDLAVGASNTLVAPFSVDVSANLARFGTGSTANAQLDFYASDADTGSLIYNTSDQFSFTGGDVAIAQALAVTGVISQAYTPAGTLATANGIALAPVLGVDATDQTFSGINIAANTNSNSDSGDVYYGVNVDNITATGSLQYGFRVGGGYDGIAELEGLTANAFETFLTLVDPTADNTITLPDASGTVILSGHTFTSDVTGTLGTGGTTALTIAANSVALGTDTTGNYVADVTGSNGITITGTPGEGWTANAEIASSAAGNGLTFTTGVFAVGAGDGISVAADSVAIALTSAGSTGSTSSNSGMEFVSGQLTLLKGCSDNELLTWDETLSIWKCNTVAGVGAGGDITDVIAGSGLTGGGSSGSVTVDIGAGTGITVNANDIAVNQATDFTLTGNNTLAPSGTNDLTFTLDSDSTLAVNQAFSSTTSVDGFLYTITNGSSSGTQNGMYIDNAAAAGATEALLVLDNSDTDTAVGAAIRIVNGGGNFTTLIDNEGTLISGAELNRLDGKDAALVDTNDAVATAITGTGALNAGSITSGFGSIDNGADAITTSGTGTFGTLSVNSQSFTDLTGNGLTLDTGALAVALTSAGTTGSTSSSSGLEFVSGQLTMIKGCSDNELLTWDDALEVWKCNSVSGVGAGGDITAVGSMTTGAAFADSGADDDWLGLGASAGRIEFDDQTIDEVNILTANVGIGTQTPASNLHVSGTTGITIGEDIAGGTPNTPGLLTFISAGDNAFSTVFQTATQTQNVTYTLPPDDGTSDYVLSTNGSGVLTWQSVTGVGAGTGDITSVTASTGLTGGGASGDVTLAFDFTDTLTGDSTLAANEASFGVSGLIFEGATANTIETYIAVTDPTGTDKTITIPDASGTVILSGHTFTSDVTGTLGTGGTTALTIAADSVALGTDTTGNYVADVTGSNGITITGTPGEGWTANAEIASSAAGNGLTFTTGVFDVGAGSGITSNANDVAVNQAFDFTFTGNNAFTPGSTSDLTVNLDNDSLLAINQTITGTASVDAATLTLTNQTSSGTQGGLAITNANDAANAVTESLIRLDNAETTASTVTDALRITSSGVADGIVDAIDVSDSNITNAINIGTNNIVTGATTIASTELDRLDGKDAALVDTNDAVATAITGTGALNAGSITSGFGSIDVGNDAITTSGTGTFGTLSVNSQSFTDLTGDGLALDTGALEISLTTSGTTGSTSSNSGLEFVSGQLSLLKGCADNEVLSWDNTGNVWECNTISGLGAGTGDITDVIAGTGLSGGGTSGSVTLDIGSGTGIAVAADAIAFDFTNALSGSIALAADEATFGQSGIIFEGATADTIETYFAVTDPTSTDKTITVPDASGTIILSGHTFTSDVTGTLGTGGTTALTIAADSVALTTDTTGNYVQSVANGTGITGGSAGSEGAALTLAVDQSTAFTWTADHTFSQASPSLLLVDTTGASDDYSINVDGNAFSIVDDTDTRTELSFAGNGSIDLGDNTTTKTIDLGGVTASAADTINIATNATAADVISIGNNNASTTLSLTGGDDWSITSAGAATFASTLTGTGAVAFTPGSTNDITFDLDSDSSLILLDVPTGTATNGLCLNSSNEVITCSNAGSTTLQTAYNNDDDGTADAIIELTGTDDSLIFRNPVASGTGSSYILTLDQMANNSTGALNITQAGTGSGVSMTFSNSGTTADGLIINNTAGTLTDAIDLSDATGITNALNVGSNDIVGSTADLDFTNFDVVGTTGNITTAGDLAVNGDDITSDGNLTIAATGYIRIGDTGTPGTATGDDALFVEGAFEVDGASTFDGTVSANSSLTIAGLLDANGQADIGDGGDTIALSGTTIGLTSNGATNDITLTSADDIILTPGDDIINTFLADGQFVINSVGNTTTNGVLRVSTQSSANSNMGFNNVYRAVDDDASDTLFANRTDVTIEDDTTGTDTVYGNYIGITQNDTTLIQSVYGLAVIAEDTGTSPVSTGILVDNQQSTDIDLTDAILVRATTNDSIVDAIDVSDAEITNAINVGANIITGTAYTISNTGAGNDITFDSIDQIVFADFTNGGAGCSALETDASGNLTCGTDDGATSAFTAAGGIIDKTTAADRLRLLYGDAGDVQFEIQNTTNSVVPTADAMQINLSGGSGITTDNVDGIYVNIEGADGTSTDLSALHLDFDPITGSSDDTFTALLIDGITGTSAVERGITIGSGWDTDLAFSDGSPAIQMLQDNVTLAFKGGVTGGGANLLTIAEDLDSSGYVTVTGDFETRSNIYSTSATANLFAAGTTTLNILDVANTSTIDIGGVTSSGTNTVNIATNATAADTINIGNSNASTGVTITGGDDYSLAATGVLTLSASAAQTTAMVVTDTDYTNALSVGDNNIVGTTGAIDYTNFDVATTGNITVAAGQGIDTNAAGALAVGNTNATSVSICNSAACDTVNIATNADADTVNIGNSTGATALNFTSGTGSQTFTSSVVSGTTTTSAFSFIDNALTTGTQTYMSSTSITTGKLLQLSNAANTLTTGTLLDVSTTSTAVTGSSTGLLGYYNWNPASTTTATGDLFRINIGGFGNIGNLFNVTDDGSSLFAISESAITSAVPHNFTAAGDLSVAYDLQFTNQTASFIKSYASLSIEAGESFESNNLTLKAYNSGNILADLGTTGNFGVNTVDPLLKFHVADSQSATASAIIENTNTGTDADGLIVKLGFTGSGNANNRFLTFMNGVGTIQGKIRSAGTTVSYDANGVDFAEYFTKSDTETFETGDLVVMSDDSAKKSAVAYDPNMIGIVSASPGFTGGVEGPDKVLTGLVGQVPLKIAANSEAIKKGDPITSSGVAGRGMKATQAGHVIGLALEDWTPGSGTDMVLTFINPTYYEPLLAFNNTGDVAIAQVVDGQQTNYQVSDLNGVIKRMVAFSEAVIANLRVGKLSSKEIATSNLTIDGKTVQQIVSEAVSQATSGATLATNVVTKDIDGNATVTGTLFAKDATISGTLYAERITGLDGITDLLGNQGASLSAMLSAWNSWNASASAMLSADAIFANEYLNVQGTASITDAMVNHALVVGGSLAFDHNSISLLSETEDTLFIQPTSVGKIDFLAGNMTISADGGLYVGTDAVFAKNLTVKEDLITSSLKSDGEVLGVQLSSESGRLSVTNGDATEVASIDASGSATFSKLALTNTATSSGTVDLKASAGTATLPANETELIIYTNQVTEGSLIYITPNSSTENKVLYVKSKVPQDKNDPESVGSFTVGVDSSISTQVKLNWWIIN